VWIRAKLLADHHQTHHQLFSSMSHSGRPLETNSLGNTFEILAMATKTIIYGMAQLMYQGV
jgi:hypothetical protein